MQQLLWRRGAGRPALRRLVSTLIGVSMVLAAQPLVRAAEPAGPVLAAHEAGGAFSAAGAPSIPTNVRLKTLKVVHHAGGGGYVTFRLTWSQAGSVSEFRVIGLKRCVRESQANDGKPCIVPHTRLKASDITRIKRFGPSARSGVVRIALHGEVTTNELWGNSGYFAILFGSYNSHGESVLRIVRSSKVCFGCTY